MDCFCNLCGTSTPHRAVLSHWDNAYYVDRKIYSLVRCARCGLVQVRNRPERRELDRYYPERYYAYDTSSEPFIRIKMTASRMLSLLPRRLASRLLLDNLYAFAPASDGDSAVLDIGCGDGSALQLLRALGFSKLYGTEIDGGRRAELERRGINVAITRDITAAGFRPATFDVVRLSHVLEHVSDPSATTGECEKLLKRGGRLLVAVPNFDAPARRLFGRYFCGLQLPTHLYHFNKSSIRRLLESHHFRIKRLYTVGYSGFSGSLLTLLRDRYGLQVPKAVSHALILFLAPVDAVLNALGLGYITTIEAMKP